MTGSHVKNLDALRAVAVILTMLFHARFFAFGWVGVWIFFVLSGFLITRSLIGLRDQGFWTGLRIFYARRSLRIFPVYFLYVTVFVVGLSVAGMLDGRSILYLYTYTTNLAPLFGDAVTGRAFAHLWSLAVEEQYYLLIAPIALLLAPRVTIALFAVMLVVGPIARYASFQGLVGGYGVKEAAELVKALTPFQMDSFMLGGLIAYRERSLRSAPSWLVAGSALAIFALSVAVGIWNYDALSAAGLITPHTSALAYSSIDDWRLSATSLGFGIEPAENGGYVWVYSLLALNSAAIIALILRFGQSFSLTVLNRVGRVSYGMYVYHSVMVSGFDVALRKLSVDKYSLLGGLAFCALTLLVWAVAEASFRYFESPFLRLKERLGGDAPRDDRLVKAQPAE